MQELTTLLDILISKSPDGTEVKPALSYHEHALKQCEWYNQSDGNLDTLNCPLCKNRGYFQALDSEDNRVMKECKCMPTRRYIKAMNAAGLGDLYEKCTFDSYKVTNDWQRTCKEAAAKFVNQDGDGWFFFAGNSGCGKTHLCTAICSELARKGKDIKYVQWKRLYERLVQTKFKDTEQFDIFRELEKVDVLYIDDFLKTPRNTSPKEEMLSYALDIVDARYKANKKTIFSTEFKLSDICRFDEALGGRIVEKTKDYQTNAGYDSSRNYRMRGTNAETKP